MSKFAIVGCEASGKTVFMSAFCDCFNGKIVPENAAANRFARFATRQLRSLREWPPATPPEKAVELNFSLREDGESLIRLGLLEFGGETFRAAFRESEENPAHRRAVNDLLAFLGDADFILVLVSLQELFRDPGAMPLEDFERDTESIWVTRGLLEFIRDKVPTAKVLIGLSQADRFTRELQTSGGPERALATRWPSIHAAAPDIPVLTVASVSATDGEGRPAEGFTTDGILPVLREFARAKYGTTTDLLLTLTSTKTTLSAAFADTKTLSARMSEISRLIKRYSAALTSLRAVRTLTKEQLANEIASAEKTLSDFEKTLKAARAQDPHRKAARRNSRKKPFVRRVFLLAMLFASVAFFADVYRPHSAVKARSSHGRVSKISVGVTPPAPVRTVTDCVTNAVGTNVVTQSASTNVVTAPAATTNLPPFRLWHDHKGKAIEARWTATAKDGKSVTLETRDGKRIRAVLYKLSEDDRLFIRETLDKRGGSSR